MKACASAPASGQDVELDIFCSKIGESYRVYVKPTWMPEPLLACFDDHGEAFPVYLDFEDLEYHMKKSGLEYTQRPATTGSVQLFARGAAATVLTQWLLSACTSSIRST